MKRVVDRSVWVGLGLLTALLVANAATTFRNTRQLYDDAGAVAHTHRVIDLTSDVLLALVDAETGERGYLLTRRDDFLEPYNAALARLGGRVARLRELTRDNPR